MRRREVLQPDALLRREYASVNGRRLLRLLAVRACLATAAGLVGCGGEGQGAPDTAAPACTPSCGARACGADGCGGICGTCGPNAACTDAGQCVATAASDCTKSCADLGLTCGEHCGESCGTCAGTDACIANKCACQPQCTVDTCEQADGCGAKCPSCPRDISCADCPLTLSVVDREVVSGIVQTVTVALDFQPKAAATLPGMADLRLLVDGDAELVEVAIGQSLITAEKGFYMDPDTGHPYREMSDGTLQLLVMSTSNQRDIPAGRWLFLKFRLGADAAATSFTPLVLALVEREEIFAPPAADAALWGSHFGASLVVWPDAEVNHAP